MNSKIQNARHRLERLKGTQEECKRRKKSLYKEKKKLSLARQNTEKALEVVKQVGLRTQQELEYHISNLVSAAISSVFPKEPYTFKVKFIERRGRTECDLLLERGGEELSPMTSVGGGVVDIVSFALRVAAISMSKGRVRPLLLMDEPFKHLSVDLQSQASMVLEELAEKIGLQIIYISHASNNFEAGTRVFTCDFKQGKSFLTTMEQP